MMKAAVAPPATEAPPRRQRTPQSRPALPGAANRSLAGERPGEGGRRSSDAPPREARTQFLEGPIDARACTVGGEMEPRRDFIVSATFEEAEQHGRRARGSPSC